MSTVYLNGHFLDKSEAAISPDDRGFLLADGIYEVSPAYHGRFFRLEAHMERLTAGLRALRIDGLDADELVPVQERLLAENGLDGDEAAYVYLQVTRGAAPRSHAFPEGPVEPTVYAFARPYRRPDMDRWEQGYTAVTVPDRRWSRVDIKSIALLPNVLALQAAVDAGADDALLIRDGVALEGAHNNFFAVFGDTVATYPASNTILHGITRACVLELAREAGYEVQERAVHVEELAHATEAFFTGTTTEVRPTVEIDGRPVGGGEVGLVARTLFRAFLERIRAETEARGVGDAARASSSEG